MKEWEIKLYAQAVASVKPAQVMVPVGYEPDLYIDLNKKTAATPGKARGTVEDYHAMWERFDLIFKEAGADNAVFVLDFSWDVRDNLEFIDLLWPRNVNIQWLFFNMFQF